MKNAYVTFTRTVRVENVEGLSEEQIKERAVEVHNEADMDDFYASEDNVLSVDIQDEEGPDDEGDESVSPLPEEATRFEEQLRRTVATYGDDHVDIFIENGKVYGMYHSKNNSFAATDDFSLQQVGGMEKLKQFEAEFVGLCICEV